MGTERTARNTAAEGATAVLEWARASYEGPTLFFDVAGVRHLIESARRAAARHACDLLFAVKSFPDARVLATFASGGVGFDVSNDSELDLVRRAMLARGAEAPLVSVNGPAPRDLVALGPGLSEWAREAMLNVVSPDQLGLLPAGLDHSRLRVGARLAFEVPVAAEGSAAGPTRFGIDPSDTRTLASVVAHPAFAGVHCHVEHQVDHARMYGQLAPQVAAVVTELGDRVSYVNLGGGLNRGTGVDGLERALRAIRAHLRDVRVLLEPGGWWFARHGFAVGRVLASERGPGGQPSRVTLDLSSECHLRWVKPRLVLPPGDDEGERELVRFCGPTCSEEDVIGVFDVPAHALSKHFTVGSTVTFGNVTGYAASWNTGFNGVPPARVILHGAGA